MLLKIEHRPNVENLRNYPVEIIKELEELLLSGGSALPDPKRKDFYDLENLGRTFFIHFSPTTAKVMLIATWLNSQPPRFQSSIPRHGFPCETAAGVVVV